MSRTAPLVLAALLCASGCGGPPSTFRATAFHADGDHYRIRYLASGHREVLSHVWRLANYQLESPRRGAAFERFERIDTDGDGRPETGGLMRRDDLRFEHRRDGTLLFVRTLPMPEDVGERALDVLADELVQAVGSHTELEFDSRGQSARARVVGTRVYSEGPVRVGGETGWMVTFDVVSLEQAVVDRAHVGARSTFVLLRPQALRWRPERRADASGRAPLLVVVAMTGRADLHDAHFNEYASLLSRLDFRSSP